MTVYKKKTTCKGIACLKRHFDKVKEKNEFLCSAILPQYQIDKTTLYWHSAYYQAILSEKTQSSIDNIVWHEETNMQYYVPLYKRLGPNKTL